jgi:hypothetical protein
MMTSTPIADWQTYLRWHLLRSSADDLSSAFVNEAFDFYGRTLTGATQMRPRWKRASDKVDGNIGEALGQLYVAKAFSPQAKERALKLVENMRAELRERIKNLDWMSEATKTQALRKLDAFSVKIGYPDQWRDYSKLSIDRGPLALNEVRTAQFEFRRNMDKLGKPVDRKEWGMTPPTVNAYYNARLNEIVFPAGILQPPFFDANADDAVNYGGIGAVIGHEMTHGFDDQGRPSPTRTAISKTGGFAADAEQYKARFVEDRAAVRLLRGDRPRRASTQADAGREHRRHRRPEHATAARSTRRSPARTSARSTASRRTSGSSCRSLRSGRNKRPARGARCASTPTRTRPDGSAASARCRTCRSSPRHSTGDGDAMVRGADERAKIW